MLAFWKGYFGYIFLILFYYLCGVILGSSLIKEDFIIYVIEYVILMLIALPNCILSSKAGQTKKYIAWLLISTVPAVAYMLYARFETGGGGGFVSFPWDWLMWEIIIPVIFALSQLVFLAFALLPGKEEEK